MTDWIENYFFSLSAISPSQRGSCISNHNLFVNFSSLFSGDIISSLYWQKIQVASVPDTVGWFLETSTEEFNVSRIFMLEHILKNWRPEATLLSRVTVLELTPWVSLFVSRWTLCHPSFTSLSLLCSPFPCLLVLPYSSCLLFSSHHQTCSETQIVQTPFQSWFASCWHI